MFVLTNYPHLACRYWQEGWYMADPHLLFEERYHDGHYFWDLHYDSPEAKAIIEDMLTRYQVKNGITIVKSADGIRNAMELAGPMDERRISQIYRDRLYLLHEFMPYFEHKAQGILNLCDKEYAVNMKDLYFLGEPPQMDKATKDHVLAKEQENIAHFEEIIQSMPMAEPAENKVSDIEKLPDLSKRQSQCAYLLLNGKTAEETGEILAISKRTVEGHILTMKDKLNAKNRSELVIKLSQLLNDEMMV